MASTLSHLIACSEGEPHEPPLEAGDHLDRRTFHRRYEAMPPGTRAELLGGVVYTPSPIYKPQSRVTLKLYGWLEGYEAATPGVVAYGEVSVFHSERAEPQPDGCLVIAPQSGGEAGTEESALVGAPELIVEVASSSASYDLHSKLKDYEAAGVRDYLVYVVRYREVRWFLNRERRFVEIPPGEDDIPRSEIFPGLWRDPVALADLNSGGLRATLERSVATQEHAAFVARLPEHSTQ